MTSNYGEGSIVKLEAHKPLGACRKWRLTVSLGSDPVTGKRRRKSHTFYGTLAQAREALRDLANEAKAGR